MSAIRGLLHRLRVWLAPEAYAREVEREIRFHLDLDTLQRRGSSTPALESELAARKAFGNVTYISEEVRRMNGLHVIDGARHNARFVIRGLRRSPAFTMAAVLTLAIGIGMTTTVFSFLNAVVLQPLALRDAGRLVTLCEQYPGSTAGRCNIAPPNALDIRRRSSSFEKLGLGRSWPVTLTTPGGRENLEAGLASDDMFEALGIRAALGRLIESRDLLGRPSDVAVISHAMWRSRYGSRTDVVGRSITLDGAPVTIVGVLEPSAAVPLFETVEIWRPLHIDPRSEQHREWRGFVAYGKLRAGASLTSASAELTGIARDLRASHFGATPTWDIGVRTLHDRIVGNVRTPLVLFLGAVSLVLIIACANVANLLLARGAARGRELAIRAALGASRAQLVATLLVESLVLSAIGAAVGVAISIWGVQAFKALAPAGVPRIEQVKMSGTVLAFSALLAIATAFVFGLAPALRTSRVDLAQALREAGRGSTRSGRMGRALVIAEVAIALPLVISAALLSRSFLTQLHWQPGFEREHVTTFSIMLPSDAYSTRADIAQIWDRLETEIRGVPGVAAVGTASGGPLFGGDGTWEMEVEGLPASEKRPVRWFDVSPGFFTALGVPFVRGGDFDATDVIGAASSGLVNETLARRFWPGQNPIGKHLTFGIGDRKEIFTVKGVVNDIPPLRPGDAVDPQLYWSNRQAPRPFTYFVVRTSVPVASVAVPIRQRMLAVRADFKPSAFVSMTERVNGAVRLPRFSMMLVMVFGIAALTLAGIGTYGLLAYVVQQQRRDIGIRLALGADRAQIIRAVLHSGLGLAVPGAAIGLVATFGFVRLIRGFIAGVSSYDPASLGISVGVVLGVAVVACIVPAWRASRVDPAVTLVAE